MSLFGGRLFNGRGGSRRGRPSVAVAPVATSISINPSSFEVGLSGTAQLSAQVLDQFGVAMGLPISWSSSNTNIATVSASGLVTPVAYGSVTITATYLGIQNTASGTVLQPTQLVVATQPAGGVDQQPFTTQPVVQLRSAGGVNVSESGRSVIATINTGVGSLVGTTTVATNVAGQAAFTNLGIDATTPPAAFTLAFASAGLTGATSASVTVNPPGAAPNLGAMESNRPAGAAWTLVSDAQWTGPILDPNPSDWSLWVDPVTGTLWDAPQNRNGPNPYLIDDPTAPTTSVNGVASTVQRVLVQEYSSGLTDYRLNGTSDGYEPKFPSCLWTRNPAFAAGFNEVFCSLTVKMASTWVQPLFSGLKWIIPWRQSDVLGWFTMRVAQFGVAGEPTFGWSFDFNECASGTCPPNDREALLPSPATAHQLTRGQWKKVQFYIRCRPTGLIQVWIDDVPTFTWPTSGTFTWLAPTENLQNLDFGVTWGGGTGTLAPDSGAQILYDRMTIWGR